MIALAVTLVVFPLVGLAAALLLRLPLPSCRFAFCYLAGLGVHGALLYLLGALRVPLVTATLVAIPVLALIVVVLLRGRLPRREPAPRHVLASLVLAVPLVVLFCAAAVMPVRDYDGRVTWLPKARAIAIEHSVAGPFFHGQRGLNLHNRYPLLLPLDAATVMALSDDTRNEAARWMYVLIPIAALLVMRSRLAALYGASGAWTAATAAWLPVLFSIEGGALAAYNDLALAAFAGVAVLSLLASQENVAGWFAAFAVLAKNEGAVLAIAVLLAALAVRRLRAGVVAPVVAAMALVAYWRTLVPAAYDEQYEVLASSLLRSLHRVPEALLAIAQHACDVREWGVFWIAVAVAVVLSRRITAPLVVIVVALAAYTFALTVTSWSIADLAKVAVPRLLLHLIVPGACLIAGPATAISPPRGSAS